MTDNHCVRYVHSTPDGDNLVAYMARVSNPSNQDNRDTAPKLIKYLIKYTSLEMVSMCSDRHYPKRSCSNTLHRSFSFHSLVNGMQPLLVIPDLRRQDTKNRQNSIDDLDGAVVAHLQRKAKHIYDQSFQLYDEMLQAGVAKECARDVLPLSTPTTLYMHGNLRSWLTYCDLRSGHGTQKEHMVIADQCKQLIATHFPKCYSGMWSHAT